MKRPYISSLAVAGFAGLFCSPYPALAQGYLGPNLRTFAVLGGTTSTCVGASVVTGDVGVSPGPAVVGFPAPCTDIGTVRVPPDPIPAAAQVELAAAYTTLIGQPCAATVGPDLAGLTLTQGVYCVTAAPTNLSGTLTLNGQGNPNAVFVFRMASTLITSSGSTVLLTNSANACGVQWQVSSSATIGSGTTFVGNIVALTAISLNTGARLTGRALARNAAVTMDTNTIGFGACGAGGGGTGFPPPFPGPIGVPTLPGIGVGALVLVLLGGGAYFLGRRTPTEASR
jgi:hypothetical protein